MTLLTKQIKNHNNLEKRRELIKARLKYLGFSWLELERQEARHLAEVLHDHEVVGAAVSGHGQQGHYMIIATNSRTIIYDWKPMFSNAEDISYKVVAGVTISHSGPFNSLILHTRLGNFQMRVTNPKLAYNFKAYIDQKCIENQPTL